MNYGLLDKRKLNRRRVLEFEKELQAKLKTLPDIERDIQEISNKRRIWLEQISSTDDSSSDIFMKKIQLLKLRTQLNSAKVTLDVCRMESHYEAQAVNYLSACTQPLGYEETQSSRDVELAKLIRQGSDSLALVLEQSLQHRLQLGSENYDLNDELLRLKQEVIVQQIKEAEEFQEKIEYYSSKMTATIDHTKENYKRVTEEYLILRHNARVAHELLLRRQNGATVAREELQACLDKIILEAEHQREKMERVSMAEVKLLTNDLRKEVIQKEAEYEELSIQVRELLKQRRKEIAKLSQVCRQVL